MIRSHTPSALAFVGADFGTVAGGCEGAAGAVGFWEQAPNTEATVASMSERSVRDIVCSRLRERHRYRYTLVPKYIAGDTIIRRGTVR